MLLRRRPAPLLLLLLLLLHVRRVVARRRPGVLPMLLLLLLLLILRLVLLLLLLLLLSRAITALIAWPLTIPSRICAQQRERRRRLRDERAPRRVDVGGDERLRVRDELPELALVHHRHALLRQLAEHARPRSAALSRGGDDGRRSWPPRGGARRPAAAGRPAAGRRRAPRSTGLLLATSTRSRPFRSAPFRLRIALRHVSWSSKSIKPNCFARPSPCRARRRALRPTCEKRSTRSSSATLGAMLPTKTEKDDVARFAQQRAAALAVTRSAKPSRVDARSSLEIERELHDSGARSRAERALLLRTTTTSNPHECPMPTS